MINARYGYEPIATPIAIDNQMQLQHGESLRPPTQQQVVYANEPLATTTTATTFVPTQQAQHIVGAQPRFIEIQMPAIEMRMKLFTTYKLVGKVICIDNPAELSATKAALENLKTELEKLMDGRHKSTPTQIVVIGLTTISATLLAIKTAIGRSTGDSEQDDTPAYITIDTIYNLLPIAGGAFASIITYLNDKNSNTSKQLEVFLQKTEESINKLKNCQGVTINSVPVYQHTGARSVV